MHKMRLEDSIEEELQVDPKQLNQAFQRALRTGKLVFLEELKNIALNDYELDGDGHVIRKAFDMMKRFIGDGSQIESLGLKDWEQFGLTRDIAIRLGQLSLTYETTSPRGRRKMSRQVSSQSEDYYDDDFEAEEEMPEEESISTLRNNFMDGGDSHNNSIRTTSTNSINSKANNRYRDDNYDNDTFASNNKKGTYLASEAETPKVNYINNASEIYSDIEEDEDGDETYSVAVSKSPPKYTRRLVESPQKTTINKMSVLTSPTAAVARQQHISQNPPKPSRPQSTTAAYSSSSSSGKGSAGGGSASIGIDISSRAAGAIQDEYRTRATTADSSSTSHSSSFAKRSGREAAIAASSASRGKIASWIANREWRRGEKIGSGSFGEVFQGMNNKGKLFAVKCMNMLDKSSEVEGLLSEIQLMRGFAHINIVAYLGAWVDSVECVLYIFQEWVPGGSVAHLLKNFGPFALGVIKNYTRQILKGLQYLHSNGIIHRDIKGGNILVDDLGTVKLADFGASTKLNTFDKTQETTTIKGTPYFMAPEVLANSRYGRKGDIWAVGCTMIQMLTGEPPWKDRNLKGLVQLHMLLSAWDQGPPPYTQEVTREARQCLELCFRKSENDRPNANELLECDFLNESLDEMDESFVVPRDGGHDPLDDSGILSGLKSEMNKAVSRSTLGLGGGRGGGDDTMAVIERQIQERQSRNSRQKLPVNPFGNKASQQNPFSSANHSPAVVTESKPVSVEDRASHWIDGLPPSQFSNYVAKPSTPPVYNQQFSPAVKSSTNGTPTSNRNVITPTHRPKHSGDVSIPAGGHSMQVISGPDAAHATAASSQQNPFSRGRTSITKSMIVPSTSSDNNYHSNHGTSTTASSSNVSHHHQRPAPSSFSALSSDANVVRESLLGNIKKKAIAASVTKSSNVSSNRDEDITPATDIPSDDEYGHAAVTARTAYPKREQDTYYTQGLHEQRDDSHYQQQQQHHYRSSQNSKHTSPVMQTYAERDSGDLYDSVEEEENLKSAYNSQRQQQQQQSKHNSNHGRRPSRTEYEVDGSDSEPELLICSPSKVPAAGRNNNIPPSINLANIRSPNSAGPDSGRNDSGRRGSESSTPSHGTHNGVVGNGGVNTSRPLGSISRSKLTSAGGNNSRPSSREQQHVPHHLPSLSQQHTHEDHYAYESGEGEHHQRNWECLGCHHMNSSSRDYCTSCALKRGADGRRGNGAPIRRVN